MTASPWFRFFPMDWLARTSGLDATHRGILINLLCLMHENGGPLAVADDVLARRCLVKKSTFAKAVETLIEAGLVIRVDGRIWSADAQRELAHREEKSTSGKTAAKKRWEKTQQKQYHDDADAMPYQIERSEDYPPSEDNPSYSEYINDEEHSRAMPSESASSSRPKGASDASRQIVEFSSADDPADYIVDLDADDIIAARTDNAALVLATFLSETVDRDEHSVFFAGILRSIKSRRLTKSAILKIIENERRSHRA